MTMTVAEARFHGARLRIARVTVADAARVNRAVWTETTTR
jgi:hypothetical protein